MEKIRGENEVLIHPAGSIPRCLRRVRIEIVFASGSFQDDANEIVDKMLNADVIELATPVYFYTMDAQLKALIDRSVSRWDDCGRFSGTEFWLVATMADTNRDMMSATLEGIRGFMRDCMEGSVERGVLLVCGAYEKGMVRNL